MVSPELLRRFPFFGSFDDDQLIKIAMISEEVTLPEGTVLFEECGQANALYLLFNGAVDLTYKSKEEFRAEPEKVFPAGGINPEEVFGISSLIEPFEYNATASVSVDSRVIVMNAPKLRELMNEYPALGTSILRQIAKTIMERLTYTRIQLAAAWV